MAPARSAPKVDRSELVVCCATFRLKELAPHSLKAAWFTLLACSRPNGVSVACAAANTGILYALNAASQTTKINKNTSKIAIEGLGRSVPDVLQRGIREIKSGVEIDNSLQLKIQAAYAQLFRIPFSLIVSPNTQRLSKPVRDAVEKTGGTIQRFDPATGTFTPFQ